MSNDSKIHQFFKRWIFRTPLEVQLVEACNAIPELRKLGTNDELEFDYLRIQELATALREELLPRGIVMIPNDLECIQNEIQTKDGIVIEARIKTEFTVTNGRKDIKFCSYGSAIDSNGFAVAIAQTMGLKAVLKRISLTYGVNDDPEVPKWARHERDKVKAYQERAWDAGLRQSGMTRAQVENLISDELGQPVTSDQIVSLPREGFDIAMEILTRHSDLTETLERSKLEIVAGKRQPVAEQLDKPVRDEIAGD